MTGVSYETGSGDVFADLGIAPEEAAELNMKSTLISAIRETIAKRGLTQKAAALCGTDQPTLSRVLRGRMESVTIDRLAAWLTLLGRTVEIHVRPYEAGVRDRCFRRAWREGQASGQMRASSGAEFSNSGVRLIACSK